jgi:hypothetical protein
VANDTAVPLNRIERVLAYMIGSSAGLSILAIVATLVANLAGVATREGAWLVVAAVPLVGLPLAFALIVVFLIVSVVRRRRLAQDAG